MSWMRCDFHARMAAWPDGYVYHGCFRRCRHAVHGSEQPTTSGVLLTSTLLGLQVQEPSVTPAALYMRSWYVNHLLLACGAIADYSLLDVNHALHLRSLQIKKRNRNEPGRGRGGGQPARSTGQIVSGPVDEPGMPGQDDPSDSDSDDDGSYGSQQDGRYRRD